MSHARAASRAWPLLAALLAASPAQAHLMNSGFGPFYDGLAHPLISPDDLPPVVAVTLLAGLGGARQGRFVLAILPGAWLAGMAAGWAIGLPPAPAWLGAVAMALIGALVADDPRLPPAAVCTVATALGALHGYEMAMTSPPPPAPWGRSPASPARCSRSVALAGRSRCCRRNGRAWRCGCRAAGSPPSGR